jgi:hypothetical protein
LDARLTTLLRKKILLQRSENRMANLAESCMEGYGTKSVVMPMMMMMMMIVAYQEQDLCRPTRWDWL